MDERTWSTVLFQESMQQTENMKVSLRLTGKPEKRHLPQLERQVGLINPDLKEDLRLVIEGKFPWPIFLHGNAGVGKTCAALSICDLTDGWYRTVRVFLRELNDAQYGRMESDKGYLISPKAYWRKISDSKLAVLDEIGSQESISNHHYDSICEFYEIRYGQPAIYISNLNLDQIKKVYDDRIASRLTSGTVIEVDDKDRRVSR